MLLRSRGGFFLRGGTFSCAGLLLFGARLLPLCVDLDNLRADGLFLRGGHVFFCAGFLLFRAGLLPLGTDLDELRADGLFLRGGHVFLRGLPSVWRGIITFGCGFR